MDKYILLSSYNDMLKDFNVDIKDKYGIYVKSGNYPLSLRKIEALVEIANMQKYFQCNPVKFIDIMFNIELLDSQALAVQRSWMCPNVLIVATRGWGKSTVIDLEIMAKDMLFNNYWTYIASGTGGQAEQTFTTLERLANDNIDTFQGSTGSVFKNEIEIKNSAGDGFSHSSNGFTYSIFNGSMTTTLNSNVDAKRGNRGNVLFDECGWLSDDMINVYGAFAIVNKSLRTGKDRDGHSVDFVRLRSFPTNIPYQKFYISSASSTDTKFYKLYREFAKKQIMGDPDYCVLHLDCEVGFNPTLHGEATAPLLRRSDVETEMRTNPEKARREFYCIFTTEVGSDAIIKRGVITRNEEVRAPLLSNDTGNKKFVICYDPARSRDNSVILVCEIYDYIMGNGKIDKRMRIVNCVNLVDLGKKIKSPMQTPDQIEYLKKVILEYNGGADNYENIIGVYIDAGSGGGGVNIADYLMADWTDSSGTVHRGLIDKVYSSDYVKKFPNAVDKIKLMSPHAYKSDMFEAMIELMNQNKISFTAPYDNKGYLTTFDIDKAKTAAIKKELKEKYKNKNIPESEFEREFNEILSRSENVKTKTIKLNWEEELALANIDALKEELVNIVRKKRETHKDSFELAPEKATKLHDDRAYTAAMASYALMCERRKVVFGKERTSMSKTNFNKLFNIRPPKKVKKYS